MLRLCLLCSLLLSAVQLSFAQVCPEDPPLNPFLADTPWPIYHRNNYAQASTCITGPLPGDSVRVKLRRDIQGGTSPWVYITEPYANGELAYLQSNATHVFKFADTGEEIIAVDSMRIDFDPITSFGWNFLLAKDKVWYTYDPKYDPEDQEFTRLFKLTDADTSDLFSEIIPLDTFNFGDIEVNRVQHFSINYSGEIVFNSDNDTENGFGTVGILSQDFEVLALLQYPTEADEITNHNAFPIDEDNSFYITTNKRLLKFVWDGSTLSLDWEAPYDFVADGPIGTFAEGSGTTPTLMGFGEDADKLVIMSDGHAKNNLVAFWRELPEGWTGIPGFDIHFADSIQLPAAETFSNTFQSIENSPTVRGYEVAIAQFNGFLGYDCENEKGVQKLTWNTDTDEWVLDWVNPEINMNGVLTYSEGANMVYGSGKEEDCNYYYYGLDWDSGELEWRLLLGPEGTFLDDPYYDGGSNNVIDANGNIIVPGGGSLFKIEIVERAVNEVSELEKSSPWLLYPNPVDEFLWLSGPTQELVQWEVFDLQGRSLLRGTEGREPISVAALPSGLYQVWLQTGQGTWIERFVKN